MPRIARWIPLGALVALGTANAWTAEAGPAAVPIAVSAKADRLARRAAEELAGYLGRLYPRTRFSVVPRVPDAGPAILLGSLRSDPRLAAYVDPGDLEAPESFAVTSRERGGRRLGIIAGADPRGAVHAVYALLEALGCGFYLSYEAVPPPSGRPFGFEAWRIADVPVARRRIVFDWHNFLSGCSGWNLADWKAWVARSRKMRFNGILVHAYGNNPMFSFAFRGETKPVGHLSTTAKGRDWGTQHVNDVRRLAGGRFFEGPVFGSEAALVADARRVDAARSLMRRVFAYARELGMDVLFALDVDTSSANPRNVIRALPEGARFEAGGAWLARPDTPEGYAYYRAQAGALLSAYPQIGVLVVWIRRGGTPWTRLRRGDLPAPWRAGYDALAARSPGTAKLWGAPSIFAIARIVAAFRRALDECGRGDVGLALGSWGYDYMPAADRFLPQDVAFIPLDYGIALDRPETQARIGAVAAHRPVIPIAWAHHDDHSYIGRPLRPFAGFGRILRRSGSAGFGVIHWTTRPLDLYFKSLARQAWRATEDEPLEATCRVMAAQSFGPPWREALGAYLEAWIAKGPIFGRETTDRFVDRPLGDIDAVIAGCRERLAMLEAVDERGMGPAARARLHYFEGLERFMAEFHRAHGALERARSLYRKGEAARAREAIAAADPASVIETYARAAACGGPTRGERGLIVSLNLRWRPLFTGMRQRLGLEAVRCDFAPTEHDPLAQGAGRNTFFVDVAGRLWTCLGARETGARAIVLPDRGVRDPRHGVQEICRTAIASDRPIAIPLRPVTGGALPAGKYAVTVLLRDPFCERPGQRVFELALRAAGAPQVRDRIDIAARADAAGRIVKPAYAVELEAPGTIELALAPVRGEALICGAVAEAAVPAPSGAAAAGGAKREAEPRSGVTILKRDRCDPCYRLYSSRGTEAAHLIDVDGREVHAWSHPQGKTWHYAELQPDGHLIAIVKDVMILELDWESRLVWKARLRAHHDFARLANGHTLVVSRETVRSPWRKGRRLALDRLVELTPRNEVAWTWRVEEHAGEIARLVPLTLPPSRKFGDWPHINTIEVLPDGPAARRDPRFRAGNLLFCGRHIDTIGVIDRRTGKVVWAWGPGELLGPHMPTMLPSGHLLVYDNGQNAAVRVRGYTRVLEVDPIAGRIVWQYRADPPKRFYSPSRGSNQRLPNGNTLIAESDRGRLLEVTPEGEIVWEFRTPDRHRNGSRMALYRAVAYPRDLVERLLRAHEGASRQGAKAAGSARRP